jgi:hypothetical protein
VNTANNKACPRGRNCNLDEVCPLLIDNDDAPPQELTRNEKKYKHIIKKLKDGRVVL